MPKFLLTVLCVSYGFRGSEITPLFFVGVFTDAVAVPLACAVIWLIAGHKGLYDLE